MVKAMARVVLMVVGVGMMVFGGCDGRKAVDWRTAGNPCSSAYLDSPQTVDGLIAENKSVPKAGRAQLADDLDADARLNEDNQLYARAAALYCRAWLLRNP